MEFYRFVLRGTKTPQLSISHARPCPETLTLTRGVKPLVNASVGFHKSIEVIFEFGGVFFFFRNRTRLGNFKCGRFVPSYSAFVRLVFFFRKLVAVALYDRRVRLHRKRSLVVLTLRVRPLARL